MLVEQQMPISSSWNKSGAEPAEAETYQGSTDQDRSLHPLLLPDIEGRNASEHSADWMLDSELHISFLLGSIGSYVALACRNRGAAQAESAFAALEAKYCGKPKKRKQAGADAGPSDEEFAKIQQDLEIRRRKGKK